MRAVGVLAAAACLMAGAPAAAEPVPLDSAVGQLNAICVASRAAFLEGGTVRLRNGPSKPVVQTQRYDPVRGRVSDTGWPSVMQRGLGTFDRSGFVLDARLRQSQIEQAARYLGHARRPWVLTKGQFGVIPSRSFRQYLRTDLLAPDRFIDLDSSTVPAQPQRCASHLLEPAALATVDKVMDGNTTTWILDYMLDDVGGRVRVRSSVQVRDGLLREGFTQLRSKRLGVDVNNYAKWVYQRPKVARPAASRVVGQRRWIRATDAAALVTDIRYLAGSLEGRHTLSGLQTAARRAVQAANRGHEVKIAVSRWRSGVLLSARNPYTREVVRFAVVLEPTRTAVSRRIR